MTLWSQNYFYLEGISLYFRSKVIEVNNSAKKNKTKHADITVTELEGNNDRIDINFIFLSGVGGLVLLVVIFLCWRQQVD